MYKYYFLLLCVVISFSTTAQNNNRIRINNAITKAYEENKYVFVNYRTTSCKLSEKMGLQMNSPTCKPLFDNSYIVVDIVVPKEKAANYFQKSSIVSGNEDEEKSSGFPFWYILDNYGNFIEVSMNINDNNIGYPSTEKEVDNFIEVIRKTSKLTESSLTVMANSFHELNNPEQLTSK